MNLALENKRGWDAPEHGDSVAPRMLKVEGSCSVLEDDQLERLVVPPVGEKCEEDG